jgi:hypothetical protein
MRRTGPSSQEFLLDPIQRYALCGRFIVGTTPNGFFILDTAEGDSGAPTPHIFAEKAEWEAALNKYDVPRGISLLNPDDVAASRPARELYPEDYVFMEGRLGLSDGQWSLATQVVAIAICLLLGFSGAKYVPCLAASIAIGVSACIVGMMFMSGGGPGFLVGLIGWPVLCCVGWGLGRVVRRVCLMRTPHEHA